MTISRSASKGLILLHSYPIRPSNFITPFFSHRFDFFFYLRFLHVSVICGGCLHRVKRYHRLRLFYRSHHRFKIIFPYIHYQQRRLSVERYHRFISRTADFVANIFRVSSKLPYRIKIHCLQLLFSFSIRNYLFLSIKKSVFVLL